MEHFESFQCSKLLACLFQNLIKYSLLDYHYLDSIKVIPLIPIRKQIDLKDGFYFDLRAPD